MARWTDPMSVAAGGTGDAGPAVRGSGRVVRGGGPPASGAGGGPERSAVCTRTCAGAVRGADRWRGGAQERGATAGAWGSAGAVSTVAKGYSRSARGEPVRGWSTGSLRHPRSRNPWEVPDSNRPPPRRDRSGGKLPSPEGTGAPVTFDRRPGGSPVAA
ncbi:hypothetical protein ACE1SV_31950 [Streptomyces sp. E-15]